MADTNKLVSLIALVIAGIIVGIIGGIIIWLQRSNSIVIADLQQRGVLVTADVARFTSNVWWYVLGVVLVIIGVLLLLWGIFQYFTKAEEAVAVIKRGAVSIQEKFRGNGGTSRVVTTTEKLE